MNTTRHSVTASTQVDGKCVTNAHEVLRPPAQAVAYQSSPMVILPLFQQQTETSEWHFRHLFSATLYLRSSSKKSYE